MKKLILLYILLAGPLVLLADDRDIKASNLNSSRSVSGKITDTFGESLPAVRIKVVETGEEYFANFEGRFNISLPADKNYHLQVDALGYQPLELASAELENLSELSLKPL